MARGDGGKAVFEEDKDRFGETSPVPLNGTLGNLPGEPPDPLPAAGARISWTEDPGYSSGLDNSTATSIFRKAPDAPKYRPVTGMTPRG